ncbi:DnaJ subfamily A member 1 [Carex littledalei]|uniref:DnaJ subfamily A member 1 n=1 Tax=Carex littledalei TaxID=544730 RepID=A0A833RGN5_9POAL|nr:DnaJ subfamily A member 1 [Carex littledalei]
MRTMAATWENIARTLKPTSPIRSTLLHYILPASFSSRCSKSHNSEEGRNQESSKTYVRYAVRQKRADAKSALKNLLFDGKPVQSVQDQTQRQRKLKTRHLNSIKEKRMKKRGRVDEGDQGNFTWTWAGETFTFPNSGPSGFEWRDNSNWHTNKKFYNESDVEDECQERSNAADLMIHRATLGLPRTGPLILDHIKSAFRSAALKWHPDKHEGPSKAIAEEKFKLCVDAYKALSLSLTQQG